MEDQAVEQTRERTIDYCKFAYIGGNIKYVIIKRHDNGGLVKLTRPSTAAQARNSFEGFKGIGITNIIILPANKVKKLKAQQESSADISKAKKAYEEVNEQNMHKVR